MRRILFPARDWDPSWHFAVGDEIQNLFLLLRRAVEISLAVAVDAGIVEPHQSSAESDLIVLVFAGDQVDKLGRARFDRPFCVCIGRDDGLAERLQRFVIVGGKNLGV